jgi:hypothetical protein
MLGGGCNAVGLIATGCGRASWLLQAHLKVSGFKFQVQGFRFIINTVILRGQETAAYLR